MRVYVATGILNLATARHVMDRLKENGVGITYDWTRHGSVKAFEASEKRVVAMDEEQGVAHADALVALLPGGKGTHVEIGIALGRCKPVYLFVPHHLNIEEQDFCNFYSHPLIYIYTDLDEMINDTARGR